MEPRGTLTRVTWNSEASDAALVATVVDPHFERSLDAGSAPGMAYAVLSGGTVIHFSGIGARDIPSGRAPDAETVFRIASMTKSFTAATVLSLRDDGQLSIDAPVVEFVPELASGGADAQEITVRHLLTMGGGFLTDDPWGDRQQDLSVADFQQLVARGLTPLWSPGVRFEYSNLGYALLGLVIEAVTGQPYREVVESRVLRPFGMTSSGYTVDGNGNGNGGGNDGGEAVVASGYVRRTSGWVREPIAGSGAFSPMGGLLSTVNDLATWVGVFQSVHAGGPQPVMPIKPASLREMQVTQRVVAATQPAAADAAPDVSGYGFGLFEDFRSWGRSVYHSGGYPGFGSHMRWHPASGLGIVALANSTYAPMSTVATAALADLVTQLGARCGAPLHAPRVSLPMLEVAQELVTAWLEGTDPEGGSAVTMRGRCADNVEIDVPWPERVALWHAFQSSHGGLVAVSASGSRPSPGAIRWLMHGRETESRVRVTVLMAPHDPDLIQSIEISAIDPSAAQPRPSTDLT